jgi:predicted dienelactone hydrolase
MARLRSFPILLAAFITPALAAAQDETVKIGGRDVAVWRPRGATSGRQPVIIFSHGFGGCGTQSKFLTEALAERGYWVFAPNHKDARCGQAGRGGSMARPEAPFRDAEQWTDKSYADRRDDVRAIMKVLHDSAALAARVDLNQLGLVGHSLGGYTVLGLAGAWSSWKTPGIKAVLALSPYAQPFLVHNTLSGLSAPVMFQGGTLDLGITPWIRKNSGGYDASPSPKYYVELAGEGHFAWTNLRPDAHERILHYSVPFLDRYVRNQTSASDVLTKASEGVSQLRYHSELGTGEQSSAGRAGRRGRTAGLVTIDANGDSGSTDISRLPEHLSFENASRHRVRSAR